MKRAEKGLRLALIILLLAVAAGCGKKKANEIDRIREAGTLQVAIVDTKSRFTQVEGGTPTGLEPDLSNYIADAIGVEAKFQVCSRKEALEAVSAGTADIALGCISSLGSLSEDYQLTTPYGKGNLYAVSRAGDYILTVGALSNSILGIDRNLDEGTRTKLYQAENIQILDYGSAKEGEAALLDEEIRVYICYEEQAKLLLEQPDLQVQNITNLDPEEFVIVTGKSCQTLANGMNTLIRQFLEAE